MQRDFTGYVGKAAVVVSAKGTGAIVEAAGETKNDGAAEDGAAKKKTLARKRHFM
jgi:hypothetical protein